MGSGRIARRTHLEQEKKTFNALQRSSHNFNKWLADWLPAPIENAESFFTAAGRQAPRAAVVSRFCLRPSALGRDKCNPETVYCPRNGSSSARGRRRRLIGPCADRTSPPAELPFPYFRVMPAERGAAPVFAPPRAGPRQGRGLRTHFKYYGATPAALAPPLATLLLCWRPRW